MRKIVLISLFAVLISAAGMSYRMYTEPVVEAQSFPGMTGTAYCMNASKWIPVLASAGGAVGNQPPPGIALYFTFSGSTLPAACDASGNLIGVGGGGLSGQTLNFLPKAATATTSTASSSISDNGVTVAITNEQLTVNSSATGPQVSFNNTIGGETVSTVCSNTGSRCDAVNNMNAGTTGSQAGSILLINSVEYWRYGITAFPGTPDWDIRDGIGGKTIVHFPSNVMPTNSITGNALGPILTAVQTQASRKGTFTCTAGGTIAISNALETATSDVIISLNTAAGTISTAPAMKTVTAATGFSVLCSASDTSLYNYNILN